MLRFFQIITIFVGVVSIIFLIWEPTVEGRNAHATLFEIYFKDPFLACVYISSILFFIMLYNIFKILENIKNNKILLQSTMKSLQVIKYTATILIILIIIAETYLYVALRNITDDIAGGVFIGILLIMFFAIIGITTIIYERSIKNKIGR